LVAAVCERAPAPFTLIALSRHLCGREPQKGGSTSTQLGFGACSAFTTGQLTRCLVRLLGLGTIVEAWGAGGHVTILPRNEVPSDVRTHTSPRLNLVKRDGDFPTEFHIPAVVPVVLAMRSNHSEQLPSAAPPMSDFWADLVPLSKRHTWTSAQLANLSRWNSAYAGSAPKFTMKDLQKLLLAQGVVSITGPIPMLLIRLIKAMGEPPQGQSLVGNPCAL